MSKTVIILGAGASVAAGAPLMATFLDEAERLRDSGDLPDSKEEFDLVFKALAALSQSHTKAVLDVVNVESVFAAFEMAKLIGRLGSLKLEEMRRVIVRTLEHTVRIPLDEKTGRGKAPGNYGDLTKLVRQLSENHPDKYVSEYLSIITFNYDLCVDLALHYEGFGADYRLDPAAFILQSVPVLKLHGSLNWGRCSGCKQLVAWPVDRYLARFNWTHGFNSIGRLAISQHFRDFHHCDGASFGDAPYVVPPTWNKSQYHAELELVWQAAARELSRAENIVVCGYSLPESDQFFRYLYALGTVGELRLKEFCVFDPDDRVGNRFKQLLGQAVIQRFRSQQYYFDQNTFGSISHLFR